MHGFRFRAGAACALGFTVSLGVGAAPRPGRAPVVVVAPVAPEDAFVSGHEELAVRVAREKRIPPAVAEALLAAMGRAGVAEDAVGERLRTAADHYVILDTLGLDPFRDSPGGGPGSAPARARARGLLERGAFEGAQGVLAAEAARLHRSRAGRDEAAFLSMQARVVLLAARNREAAGLFAAAAQAAPDPVFAWTYKVAGADALRDAAGLGGDGTAALRDAAVVYRDALRAGPRDQVALQWAFAEAELGRTLRDLDEREGGTGRLPEAVAAFRDALTGLPREEVPLDWAVAQNDLGDALWALAQDDGGTANLRAAVEAYRAALTVRTRERMPLDWALTENSLGSALAVLGQRDNDPARLREAVAAFRAALEERTREREPQRWAETQGNLGHALVALGRREDGTASLREAVAAFDASLAVAGSAGWAASLRASREEAVAEMARRRAAAAPVVELGDEGPRYVTRPGATFRVALRTSTTRDGTPSGGSAVTMEWKTTAVPDQMTANVSVTMRDAEGGPAAGLNEEGKRAYLLAMSDGNESTFRSFFQVTASSTFFSSPANGDGSFKGAEAGRRFRSVVSCPWDAFDRFFPIGAVPSVSMECTAHVEGLASPQDTPLRVVVSSEGDDVAHTAAGDLPVRRVHVSTADGKGMTADRVLLFSERLGMAVLSDSTTRSGGGDAARPAYVTTIHTETVPAD